MQLCALNDQKQLIHAKLAKKQTDYYCLECGGIVRLRGGIHRQDHFYHLDQQRTCRLNAKSMQHIQTQNFIWNVLPKGEVALEHRFPSINRISDVVWFNKRLIFEVQCSPITAEEVGRRNRDYAKEGYRVVWVLHDRQFNQWKLSAAELYLQGTLYFYSNIDSSGQGMIYDQFDVVNKSLRVHKLGKLKVDVSTVMHLSCDNHHDLLKVRTRLENFGTDYFLGDLTHLWMKENKTSEENDYLEKAIELQQSLIKENVKPFSLKEKLHWWFVRPYLIVFRHLLEKATL